MPSLGRDPTQREDVIQQAILQGRLRAENVRKWLPAPESADSGLRALALAAPDKAARESFRNLAKKFLPQIRERLDRERSQPLPGGKGKPKPISEAPPQPAAVSGSSGTDSPADGNSPTDGAHESDSRFTDYSREPRAIGPRP